MNRLRSSVVVPIVVCDHRISPVVVMRYVESSMVSLGTILKRPGMRKIGNRSKYRPENDALLLKYF